ncbi:MAG: hypothetical protein KAG97_01820, partial [Victivallales bacterium]|nr:hypothetical protein [Victivallales bacterium]
VDLNSVIDDFCDKAYGKAGRTMRAYFDLMEKSFMACHFAGIHPGNIPDWYSPETFAKALKLLNEAAKLADIPERKDRVEYCRIGFDYTEKVVSLFRVYRKLNDCGLPVGLAGYTADTSKKHPRSEIAALLKSALKLQKDVSNMLDEYKTTSLIQPYSFRRQNEVKRWFKTIDEYWSLYGGTGKKQKLTALPDVWKFKTDPKDAGVAGKWHAVNFNDSSWKNIRIDKHWEKQGYENYDGYAWYRLDGLEIPKEKISGKYILRLGAVDESCWVYVNGRLAGSAIYDAEKEPDGWKKPRRFDITRFLKPGAGNVIVIRVQDERYAGGIWRRAFLIQETAEPNADSKVVFSEKFEKNKLSENYSTHAKFAKFAVDGGTLSVVVTKPFPAGFSMSIPKIKIDGARQYVAAISYRLKNVQENADQKRNWLKHPKLPNVRLIFLDAKGKTCVPVKKYVWFGGKFMKNSTKTLHARRVFKSPPNAAFVRLTIYLQAKGEYRLDDITIETF